MSKENKSKLIELCEELMKDYKKHSKTKEIVNKITGRVIYQEFFPKHSKLIIDEIDDVLANHYGFTAKESEFIKTFDLQFRMGEEEIEENEEIKESKHT